MKKGNKIKIENIISLLLLNTIKRINNKQLNIQSLYKVQKVKVQIS